MSYGEKSRAEGYKYEKTVVKEGNLFSKDSSKPSEQSVESILGQKQTTSKSDISIFGHNISVKNPGHTGASIQMFVTSQKNTLNACKCDEDDVHTAVGLFFGNPDEKEFKSLLSTAGINEASLEYDSETRRKRLKFSSIPQKYQSALLSFLNENKRFLVECALQRGWAKSPDTYPDFMLWSDSSLGGKSSLQYMCLLKMHDVIDNICAHDWKVRPSGTVFEIGALTLQMKGSGTGMPKHHFQFKTSLRSLRDSGVPFITAKSEHIFEILEAA